MKRKTNQTIYYLIKYILYNLNYIWIEEAQFYIILILIYYQTFINEIIKAKKNER